ncbi:hypothetical protein RJ639_043995 [Escallonia herrerae]|uniref:Uncharacterized protein n=1 Tax=Escallonia herrerae TaxID=1293975 RepID=A0AA89B093_9ASTE|nr:hypothetical protein RJ639_043995 [Escallonia herrerae]
MGRLTDLPGFYYDEEKNRYFPIKGPIPGSSSRPSSSASTSAPQKSDLKPTSAGIARFKTAKLLQARELYGNVITSGKGRFSFQEEYLKLQASQPMIWKYQGTERVADGALEQIRIDLDIPDGPIETDVLLTGGLNGSLCY